MEVVQQTFILLIKSIVGFVEELLAIRRELLMGFFIITLHMQT